MSTTLTNGLKLPDKGSVDWYADMQSNYAILDGAVGTVAEHTTQIAGKAPLVHTHTKSDITDFPAYGTTAGTICEGNDSRLSDARTPVAHTHGKADITDLFNSANTWTEGQTIYSYANIQSQVLERAVTPANTAHVSLNLRDKNNHDLGIFRSLTYNSSGNSIITVFGVTQIKDGQVDPTGTVNNYGFTETCKLDGTKYFTFDGYMGSNLEPLSVNQSIGSASNQWNNLYAKNYYYNGTAWGLDKANIWSQNQAIANNNPKIYLKNVNITKGVIPSSNLNCTFMAIDSAGEEFGRVLSRVTSAGATYTWLAAHNLYKNGTLDTTGTDVWANVTCYINSAGVPHVEMNCDLFPNDGITNASLGTSTNKWKTLNGINPGALSLPNFDSDGYTDLSSDLTENVQYTYTPTVDGWLALFAQVTGFHAENAVGIFNGDTTLGNNSFRWAASATAAINLQRQTGKYFGSVFLPVRAGYPYLCWLRVNQSTPLGQKWFIFYKAKGNV